MLATVLAVAQRKCCYNLASIWPWTRYKQVASTAWIASLLGCSCSSKRRETRGEHSTNGINYMDVDGGSDNSCAHPLLRPTSAQQSPRIQ
eukprot:7645331-Lingulodinium_polyedra.AAC.1